MPENIQTASTYRILCETLAENHTIVKDFAKHRQALLSIKHPYELGLEATKTRIEAVIDENIQTVNQWITVFGANWQQWGGLKPMLTDGKAEYFNLWQMLQIDAQAKAVQADIQFANQIETMVLDFAYAQLATKGVQ